MKREGGACTAVGSAMIGWCFGHGIAVWRSRKGVASLLYKLYRWWVEIRMIDRMCGVGKYELPRRNRGRGKVARRWCVAQILELCSARSGGYRS